MIEDFEFKYHLSLGDMLSKQGDHKSALGEYYICQSINSTDMSLMTRIGNKHFYLGNLASAQHNHNNYMKSLGWGHQYKFTRNTFTNNLYTWKKYFETYKDKTFNYLEIGSFEGMSAVWVADYCPKANINCIDISFQDNFYDNIASVDNNVNYWEGKSDEILLSVEQNSMDVIYIDGSHKATDTFKDACLSWKLLKSNGMMIFDDYNYFVHNGPKYGIDTFLSIVKDEIQILHKEYQLILTKK
jgi:hypothetical protein